MVWNAGVRPWWAATAEIFKSHLLLTFAVDPFQRHAKPTLTNNMQRKVNFVFHLGGGTNQSSLFKTSLLPRLDSINCGKSLCIS
jgi:hypothetical protein